QRPRGSGHGRDALLAGRPCRADRGHGRSHGVGAGRGRRIEKAPHVRGFACDAAAKDLRPYIQPASSCLSSLPSWLLSTASNSALRVALAFASLRLMLPLPLLSSAAKSIL